MCGLQIGVFIVVKVLEAASRTQVEVLGVVVGCNGKYHCHGSVLSKRCNDYHDEKENKVIYG
jgi:hypothetical protein